MSYLYLEELRQLYHTGRLIPFVGAGVSMSVKWKDREAEKRGPSWSELVDRAAKIMGFESPELLRIRGTDLQILEYFGITQGSFAELTNWLFAEMRPPDEALLASRIHEQLAQSSECSVIYTTNYDDFIERAFRLRGRKVSSIATEAQMGIRQFEGSDACEVVKFHGDWGHPEAMVISESHYEQRLKLNAPMDFRLRADVLGRALLFIGYSFRDWNVSYLFRLVNEQFDRLPDSITGRRAYITVSDPSIFEERLFRHRNIGVIPVSGSRHTEDVADLLRQIRGG